MSTALALYGAPGDSAATAVAQSQQAANQARIAQAWNAGGRMGPGSLAQQQAGIAYNSAFRARAMGASIPESVWSAAGAGFQRRPVPVSPWTGVWSPAQPGSGIRPLSGDLASAEGELMALLGGGGSSVGPSEAALDAELDAEIFGALRWGPRTHHPAQSAGPQSAQRASQALRRARVAHSIEPAPGALHVHTPSQQLGRAHAILEQLFGVPIRSLRKGRFRGLNTKRVLVVPTGPAQRAA